MTPCAVCDQQTQYGEIEMLQSYQALYDHGRLTWLTDKPSAEEAHVIVTLLPPEKDAVQKLNASHPRVLPDKVKFWAISSRQSHLLRIGKAWYDFVGYPYMGQLDVARS